MSKFLKILLFSGAAIGAILFLASISVNLYLQSKEVREQISYDASSSIGRSVTIQNISYFPWKGIILTDVQSASPEGRSPMILVEIAKIRLHIRWIPLIFQRKILLSSVHVQEPTITIYQKVPQDSIPAAPLSSLGASSPILSESHPPTSHSVSTAITSTDLTETGRDLVAQNPSTSSPVASHTHLSHPPSSHKAPILTTSEPAQHSSLIAPKIVISGGKLFFHPHHPMLNVMAKGISAELTPTEDDHFSGPLICNQINISEKVFFKNLRASLSCNPNALQANAITASLAKGQILGEFRCQLNEQTTFEWKTKLVNASLEHLIQESGYDGRGYSGSLSGDLWLSHKGEHGNPQGKGSLELLQGQLEPTEFLRQLGQILRIKELERLCFKKAILSFEIEKERVVFDNIFLESENLILKGTGPMKFNGRLDIAAQLLFNDYLYSKYRALIGKNLSPSSVNGYHEVAFHVYGETSHPQADLLDKLTGISLQKNIGGILQQFIGWPQGPSTSQPPE